MTPENEKAAVDSSGASNVHFLTANNFKDTNPHNKSQAIRIADTQVLQ
jgi:hypothetical protein